MLSAASGIDPDSILADFRLAPRGAVIAAVSGGSDSLALLFLLKAFLDANALPTRLVAVTVDHGLRPASVQEAEAVAALCRVQGVGHRTMRWTGVKPASGLPAAAREARYRLLAVAAEAEGTDIILTGHTLDDQVETVAMRSVRGDGRGLAGMAPATLFDGRVWILRPLLGTRRAALRGYLADRGIDWIDDPTNVDDKYERARVRSAGRTSGQDAVYESARREIATAATGRIALGEAAADLIRSHVRLAAPGLVMLDSAFAAGHEAAGIYALRILLAALGGKEQLPDTGRSEALFARLGKGNFRATLSRAVVDARRSGIFIRRENRGLPTASDPSALTIWDGRFLVSLLPKGMTVAPVGIAAAAASKSTVPPPGTPSSLVKAALAAEPAVWRGGEFVDLAADAGFARRIIAPWARFLPSFDLAPARAVAEMLGADVPPEPPLAGHNRREG